MKSNITIRTLTDGGQPASEIATAIAAFLDGAERSLELAQYDFDLRPESAATVGDAADAVVSCPHLLQKRACCSISLPHCVQNIFFTLSVEDDLYIVIWFY